MKKMIIVGVLVFAFAFTMNMAFAGFNLPCSSCNHDNDHQTTCPCPSVTVNNSNSSTLNNTTKAASLTGGNTINVPSVHKIWFGSSSTGTGAITTGNASAVAGTQNTVGVNETHITSSLQTILVNNSNVSTLNNTTKAFAGTGKNVLNGAGTIGTGAAASSASTVNMVGSNLTVIN